MSAWTYAFSRHLVWDGRNLAAVEDGNNILLQTYTWEPNGQLLAETDYTATGGPKTDQAISDLSGNMIMLVDPKTDAIDGDFHYGVSGQLLSANGSEAANCLVRGKGELNLPEIANIGFSIHPSGDGSDRAVNYVYSTFMQRDVAGELAGGYNLYTPFGRDPVNRSDTSGLAPDVIAPAQVQPSPVSKVGPIWTPDAPIGTQAAQAFIQGQVAVGMAQAFIGAPGQVPMAQNSFTYWQTRLANDVQNGLLDANQAAALQQSFKIDPTNTVATPVIKGWTVGSGRFTTVVQSDSAGGPLNVLAPTPTAWWTQQYRAALAQRQAAIQAAAVANQPTPVQTPAASGGAFGPPAPPNVTTSQPSNQQPKRYINISTLLLTSDEIADLKTYAKSSNAWLLANGGVTVLSTSGALRAQASAAARLERTRAAAAGTPYLPYPLAQVGHVPDTALTGLANPPLGWLQMRGISNSVVGGALGPRVGQHVDGFTIDGKLP